MKTFFITLIGALFCLTTISTVGQPIIIADGPLEFCAGDSVTLCIQPDYVSYEWNTGATTNCITATESGEYYAIVVDNMSNIDSSLFYNSTVITTHNPQPNIIVWYDSGLICTNQFASWQWYLNGEPIQGATDPAYTPTEDGIYHVEGTDDFGCVGSSNAIDFTVPNGIGEVGFHLLDMFPNPTSGNVRIDFGESINDVNINVFSPLGSLVYTTHLNHTRYFDLELPEINGIYFIQLLGSDGEKSTLKVIKE